LCPLSLGGIVLAVESGDAFRCQLVDTCLLCIFENLANGFTGQSPTASNDRQGIARLTIRNDVDVALAAERFEFLNRQMAAGSIEADSLALGADVVECAAVVGRDGGQAQCGGNSQARGAVDDAPLAVSSAVVGDDAGDDADLVNIGGERCPLGRC